MKTVTPDLQPNDFGFILSITLASPPAPMSQFLVNLRAEENAKLVDIKAKHIARWNAALQHHIECSEEQQNTLVVYDKDIIEFKKGDHSRKTYHFPTNRVTMRQFIDAIVDFALLVAKL